MGIIADINRAVERIYKATINREKQEHRPFGDILKEEIDKLYKEKAIQDDRQEILDSK
ncbi:hypothetical protein CLOBY_27540 [Clostridium saccharobutylicum]|uniref:hypothetical protein n=1 Tax=Clostridium saccharobutylicum TaxID=169679 RepID=UPI000983DB51|nr:hypothetical protein [Clostridium saccharobutylicum]AQS10609.1 hypothetical protein CLOBY_27540 [Clostridium saccharobutylicum]MBC2438038.1 hypothetical protein [Clostridium saccharobutylicum]NSB90509.1 hypothetical protein [Clostridium saccharobutylicum]NYC31564.1 hypothetical protein [Clostridium saccharobutylicum]OOM18882.1 hypothetical protein CLSAB_03400 [Clostridium saccharobutylicum]